MIYDVIIIGAGPAGCFAAHEISKYKINGKVPEILVLEASKTLKRYKPCGGEHIFDVLKELPELKKIVVGETENTEAYYNNKKVRHGKAITKTIYFTRRDCEKSLNHILTHLTLRKKNIKVGFGKHVSEIKEMPGWAKVVCDGKEHFGKIIIDASGALSNFYEKTTGLGRSSLRYTCSVIEFKPSQRDLEKLR